MNKHTHLCTLETTKHRPSQTKQNQTKLNRKIGEYWQRNRDENKITHTPRTHTHTHSLNIYGCAMAHRRHQ